MAVALAFSVAEVDININILQAFQRPNIEPQDLPECENMNQVVNTSAKCKVYKGYLVYVNIYTCGTENIVEAAIVVVERKI